MARKSKDYEMKILAAFVIGVLVGIVILYSANYFSNYSYPRYYMMPMMMRGMMNYQYSYQGNVNCNAITSGQFEQIGDTFMTQMMGQTFDQQMDARMTNETATLMHIMMGRMYLGC